jgi:hypothetical protein
LVEVLYLKVPATGVAGRCAVVPVGTIKPPVVEAAVITPDSAVKARLPVVSAVTLRAVPEVVPADMIEAMLSSRC